jgi:hypothetical protein
MKVFVFGRAKCPILRRQWPMDHNSHLNCLVAHRILQLWFCPSRFFARSPCQDLFLCKCERRVVKVPPRSPPGACLHHCPRLNRFNRFQFVPSRRTDGVILSQSLPPMKGDELKTHSSGGGLYTPRSFARTQSPLPSYSVCSLGRSALR